MLTRQAFDKETRESQREGKYKVGEFSLQVKLRRTHKASEAQDIEANVVCSNDLPWIGTWDQTEAAYLGVDEDLTQILSQELQAMLGNAEIISLIPTKASVCADTADTDRQPAHLAPLAL